MPAGYNQYGNIRRFEYGADDNVGGANPTGTVIYRQIPMRIEPIMPTMALLEQGLVSPHFYSAAISADATLLKENDEVEVILPTESWYYGYRFRINSVRHASLRPQDARTQTQVIMRRVDDAHGKTISA